MMNCPVLIIAISGTILRVLEAARPISLVSKCGNHRCRLSALAYDGGHP